MLFREIEVGVLRLSRSHLDVIDCVPFLVGIAPPPREQRLLFLTTIRSAVQCDHAKSVECGRMQSIRVQFEIPVGVSVRARHNHGFGLRCVAQSDWGCDCGFLPPSPGLPLVGVLGFWYMAVFMFAGLHCIACSASESNKKKRSDQTMR